MKRLFLSNTLSRKLLVSISILLFMQITQSINRRAKSSLGEDSSIPIPEVEEGECYGEECFLVPASSKTRSDQEEEDESESNFVDNDLLEIDDDTDYTILKYIHKGL